MLGRGWDREPNEVRRPAWLCAAPTTSATRCFASVELARELLGRGALYGAAGVVHDPELTRVLLEAGADPNAEPHFGDALYHSVEAESPVCLRLLLEHGAEPRGSNALAHALDYNRPQHVRLLLDAGADPNEGALVHAVRRGRDPEFLRLLAEHGADLDRRGGEWSTPPEHYRTAYQNPVLRGLGEHAGVLAELGASTDVAPEDLAIAAVARGERPAGGIPAELTHDAQEVLALAALDGGVDLVVDLVGPNFFGHVGGGPPGTLLHHAAWVGNAQVVRRLLERGGDPVARSGADFDTPLAWAVHGSPGWQMKGRDYVAVAELLVAAGAELEPRLAEAAEGGRSPSGSASGLASRRPDAPTTEPWGGLSGRGHGSNRMARTARATRCA